MKRRWKKEQGGPAHPTQKGAARDLAFFPVVACHRWVLEELQISVVMLALKYSQAKLAAFFRSPEKSFISSAAHREQRKFSRNEAREERGSASLEGSVNERRGKCG
ncbi:MAG: hypothetical protein WAN12_04720 [Candidatus Acidiferrum sp.]